MSKRKATFISQFFSKAPKISTSASTSSVSPSTSASTELAPILSDSLVDKRPDENVQGSSSSPPYHSWIRVKGFDESLNMNVFSLHADGGIICLICSKHSARGSFRGKTGEIYTSRPARPQRPSRLDNHLSSEQHKQAVTLEKTQRTSSFHALHEDRIKWKLKTISQRVHLIYWTLKQEISNRKVHDLQALVDRIGNNDRLRDLGHTSSTSVSEFILLIADHLNEKILAEVKQSPCWSSMVDETTDIATLQQYITFIKYVDKRGEPATAFLDIRHIDERGATAQGLFDLWNEVAEDYELDVSKHVAIACDGAAVMLGCRNSLTVKLKEQNQKLYSVHCYAHRLALACTDTVKDLQEIRSCERTLVQTWKFFSISPKKSEKLKSMQAQGKNDHNSLNLAKACKTRWLSHDAAVKAMKLELLPVYATLKFFAEEKEDCTASGVLRFISRKSFLFSLYLLSSALPHLKILSLTFQSGDFNFSHASSALATCKSAIASISTSDEVVSCLREDWADISSVLPEHEKSFGEADVNKVRSLTAKYCKALLENIDERFPEPEVLSAFGIFDRREVPSDFQRRKDFGKENLRILFDRFIGSTDENFCKVLNDYQTLKDRLVMEEFSTCKDAGEVCRKIARDPVFLRLFPELHYLCCVAITIPLATAWPERGFSAVTRIKTKNRNRLLDTTLNALVGVSINGPKELSDHDAEEIAQKWKNLKQRRKVTVKAIDRLADVQEEEISISDHQDQMETSCFIL